MYKPGIDAQQTELHSHCYDAKIWIRCSTDWPTFPKVTVSNKISAKVAALGVTKFIRVFAMDLVTLL
jgi:hypothetical protein